MIILLTFKVVSGWCYIQMIYEMSLICWTFAGFNWLWFTQFFLVNVSTHIMQICGDFDVAKSCWICSDVISMVPFTHAMFFIVNSSFYRTKIAQKKGSRAKKSHCKKIAANSHYVCQDTYWGFESVVCHAVCSGLVHCRLCVALGTVVCG